MLLAMLLAGTALARPQIDVAAYVWPAYQNEPRWAELGIFKAGKGEWQNVWEAVPKWDGHRQPLYPTWGYEDESDPKVVEKKIDAAVSHGVNVFIYDWYWYGGRPFLENGINRGFLGAKNNGKMKFFVMWANHHVNWLWDNKVEDKRWESPRKDWLGFVSDEEFRTKLVPRWIGQYFNRPNYYRIGGKPVLMIYEVKTFVKGVGGVEKAAQAIAYLRAEAEKAGLGGVHLMACDYGVKPEWVKALGIDSASIYNFVHWSRVHESPDYDDWSRKGAERFDIAKRELGVSVYFPHASVGWDTNPRYPAGSVKPIARNSTPEKFEQSLRRAKGWCEKNTPEGMPRMVTVNSWNEWTEGSYLEPDSVNGFGYLDAIKRVFTEEDQMSAVSSIGNVGTVRLKGYLGSRLDSVIARHVGGTDIDYITAPFLEKTERRGWWQTEFWGKYMHSAVPYAVYSNSEKIRADLARGVERILASQEPGGYIGNYPDELRCGEGWDVWGMKYTMMGLMHYYDYLNEQKCGAGSERVLAAAKRLCDYVIGEIGPNGRRGRELWETGNWSGYASSSILEPVVWLYRRCHERKYLDFASFIVKGMSEPESGPRLVDLALKGVSVADRNGYGNKPEKHGGYVMKHNRWKSYEMMSCYQGMLDYAEELDKLSGTDRALTDRLRRAAVMTAEDIVKEEINLAGGCACSEAWFHGARKQHLPHYRLQETCVTTTWLRFCEKILSVTGDTKWADEIEKTFYNAYLGAMKADGSKFEAYTPLSGDRWHGMHHCYMHTDCCTANGPRGFLVFLRKLCEVSKVATTFNFYATALVPGFDMYSLYPREGYVRIVSHTEGQRTVRLRIPGWCESGAVKVNGEEAFKIGGPGKKDGGYAVLDRTWKLGDIVEVTLDMPVVAHTLEHNVAFTRGPVLLARDSRFNDGDMMCPFRSDTVRDGQKMSGFSAVRTPSEDMWMAFSGTLPIGSHFENPEARNPTTVFFCDYASAGNTWRRDNFYRTWFPISLGPHE